MRGLTAAALTAVLLAGCASAKLAGEVGKFQTVTDEAVKAQSAQIASFAKQNTERVYTRLATQRVELTYTEGCIDVVLDPAALATCHVEDASGERVQLAFEPTGVLALGAALSTYAARLVQLAADSDADVAVFDKSIDALAQSVSQLSGAIAAATESAPAVSATDLNAVADIAAKVGGVYLQYQRERALRDIIIASNPFIVEATRRLADADGVLRGYDVKVALANLERAQQDLRRTIEANGSAADIGPKQKVFLTRFDEFRAAAVARTAFINLGNAHDALATVAASGASMADMRAYMRELMSAAEVIAQSYATLRK